MLYTSTSAFQRKRFHSVKSATEETAKRLKLGFEVIKLDKNFSQIFVYYENDDAEPIPIYCDGGKTNNVHEIREALKNMIFVLSFHPAHTALRHMRKRLMESS